MVKKSTEAPFDPEVEAVEMRAMPFQEQEEEITTSVVEKNSESIKIDPKSKKAVDGLLARDAEKISEEFALAWFNNNEEKMRNEGRVIPPGVSDEWKISMVLSSKERGGMGVSAEINDPIYKSLREQMDRIGVLRTDLKKNQTPPEAPFLLLNYLQNKFEDDKKELVELRDKASAGDANAETYANSKEAELKELSLLRREVASKTMNEDLVKDAERKVAEAGFPLKEEYIDRNMRARKQEIKVHKMEEIIDKEYQAYKRLPLAERKKYQKNLGQKLETYGVPGQTPEELEKANREMFRRGIVASAPENVRHNSSFYGLLEQGYKPHEYKRVGMPWKRKNVVKNKEGNYIDLTDSIIQDAAIKYDNEIASQAKEKSEILWDSAYEKSVNNTVEMRIEQLAKSPDEAEGGIKEVYRRAKERIVAEYIKKRMEKEPLTKEDVAKVEKILKEKGKEKKITKDVNDFMADVLLGRGKLSKLSENFNKSDKNSINEFLEDWGIDAGSQSMADITREEYSNARKKPVAFFSMIKKIIEKAINPVAKKKRKIKTKTK